MTFGVTQDFKQDSTAIYDGKAVHVISTNDEFAVIEDSQGNRLSVKKEALKAGNIWNYFVDPEVLAEYDERILTCEKERSDAKDYLESCKDLFYALFDKFNANFKHELNPEQLAQVQSAEKAKYSAQQAYTASSNELQSTLIDKFIYVT